VRSAIAEQAVDWVLIPSMLVATFAGAMVFATVGLSEPSRLIPLLLFFASCLWVYRLKRAERWLEAAAVMCSSVTLTIVTAVLLNSVYAPAYWVGLMLLSLVVPLFGLRWGIATALLLMAAGAVWLALDHFGMTIGVRVPAASTTYTLYVGFLVIALCLLCGPHFLLVEALNEAQLKRAEAEEARLAEAASELAFHAVFDQASMALVLLTSQGKIAQLNHRALGLFGASGRSLIGQALPEAALWTDAQRDVLRTAIQAAASGERSHHELIVTNREAGRRVFQLAVSPYHTREGRVGHVIAELADVTDLIDTRSMLAAARRLEALGKLSGGVAHDINNMLGAILNGSELVQLGLKSGDTRRIAESAELIQGSVVRAASLTKQLLAFGRKDRWSSEQVDVNRLLSEVVLLLGRTLRKNIDLAILPSDDGCYVRADAAALEHALLNLALNAQDALPNGGTVTFRCRRLMIDAASAHALSPDLAPGPTVVLTVADTGLGMTEEVRERMFEPFFTTKAIGQGTGLGLSAVHGTIHSHGGAIAVSSTVGLGTTIVLYLPAIAQRHVEPADERARPIVALGPMRPRVLLADDEAFARQATVAMLESLGCEVQAVADGTSLIDALAEGANPDLVVSDLAMPGLGGVRLVQTLEAILHDRPLLLITGFSGDDVSKTCPPRRNRQLLRKPFTRSELQQAIVGLLGPLRLGPRAASEEDSDRASG
jgi:PAS domain S-box-containing protein